MISIDLQPDLKALDAGFDRFARQQLPFATALALTAVARMGQAAERAAMARELDRPAPFTLRGITAVPARKDNLAAFVRILPQQARYLAPSIEGGLQIPAAGGRAILAPKNVRLNAYGNIPKGLLASLRSRPDIFIGEVTFHDGNKVAGVWQLPPGERKGGRSSRGIVGGRRKGWKLLIRFADPVALEPRYQFGEATLATASASFLPAMRTALGRALATAR